MKKGVVLAGTIFIALYIISLLAPQNRTVTIPSLPVSVAQASPMAEPSSTVLGVQTKSSGCQTNNALPDSTCTPGAALEGITKADVCKPGYAQIVRNVSQITKDKVFAEYGIVSHQPGEYEVDHLISLELGGSNDLSNLWPEPAEPKPGFHEKDKVENYLHAQVCAGEITLQQAQQIISQNWLQVLAKVQ